MEFLLPDNNPWNNIIHLPDGRPVYHVETHIGIFSKGNTVIKRISGAKSAEMSVIDSHSSWDDNLVQVWGHDRAPRREGHIST
ncbi:hypothetical protein L218DRAFT_129397 [Marasmius fiardii PR-910]|nr:hypothetical protein L218DRAFT_129397 [Marasmius fiardii PR-910]